MTWLIFACITAQLDLHLDSELRQLVCYQQWLFCRAHNPQQVLILTMMSVNHLKASFPEEQSLTLIDKGQNSFMVLFDFANESVFMTLVLVLRLDDDMQNLRESCIQFPTQASSDKCTSLILYGHWVNF